jgi:uncharacterized protein YndB with AHSA1/START domain
MSTTDQTKITVETTINATVEKVWELWTTPEHIIKWNNASDDWHTPSAENDLRTGGKFSSRMEAKDGSVGFNFEGYYDDVIEHQRIYYHMADGRTVDITFKNQDNTTSVTEVFDAEHENAIELQKQGWQSILNNFKAYVESNV